MDVDRGGPDLGSEGAATLYEVDNGSNLVPCRGGGYDACVEEQPEEGGLAGAPACDH